MRDIVISLGRPNNLAAVTKTVSTSWPKFAKFLTKQPPETEDKASVGWYCAAQFDPEYRDSKNFVARHCLTFDYDEIDPCDLKEIREAYAGFAYVMYTTASHTSANPRIRLVMPLSRACGVDEFCAVTRNVAQLFNIEKLARESDTPAQMMFLPSTKPGKQFHSVINHGEWIDVDKVLGEYDDWHDRTNWPRRLRGDSVVSIDDVEAPDRKQGIVGDFCRAFRIPEAIRQFELPYEQGSNEDRYTYKSGSRPDGLRLYDDGLKAHSDHNTDPANGQHNAFDLVRLHKYGELDDDPELPITQQPSYKAMCAFAMEQPELQQARIANEFEDLGIGEEGRSLGRAQSQNAGAVDSTDLNRFKVIPAPEFASDISLDWLIKGVMPKAELLVLYGESGSGKSFLALDFCAAIVRGVAWRERTVSKGRIVYVCAEGASGFKQRLRAYSRANSVELNEFGVVGEAPNLLDEKDAGAITHAIYQYGKTDLVVIDTLSAVIPGGDENTGKDLGKVVEHCRFIHRKTGALVVLIHHSGKDASKGARGWSGLRAAADAEIEITRNGDFRTAMVTKMKDGSDGRSWPFKLQTVVLGVDDDGDEITSCVIEHVDAAPIVSRGESEPQGLFAKNALRVARRIGKTGELMDMEALVGSATKALPRGDAKRDTRRQQTQRAIQKLVVDGLLFLHDDNKISLTTAEPSDEEWMDE